MRVVVAKRHELLMALLQDLEPRQPFVDRNLRHRSPASRTTTMARAGEIIVRIVRVVVRIDVAYSSTTRGSTPPGRP
jgi:hypothetical protein